MSDEEKYDIFTQTAREFFGDDLGTETAVVDEMSYPAILRSTEARIEEGGWDQPPIVGTMRGNELGAEVGQLLLPDEINENFPIAFPRFVLDLTRYINKFGVEGEHAPFLRTLQTDFLGPTFQGVFMSSEGWTVLEPDRDTEPEKWTEWERAQRVQEFHIHPDRIETRITMFITPNSDVYWITRNRGEEPQEFHVGGEEWVDGQLGMLSEFLRGFLRACIALNYLQGLGNDEVAAYWARQAAKYGQDFPGFPEVGDQ